MSDTKPTATKQPDPFLQGGKSIPVKTLWFRVSTDVPGKSGASSVTTSPDARPGQRWEVEFLPHMRHHRVTWYSPDGESVARMIHESQCTWEPA